MKLLVEELVTELVSRHTTNFRRKLVTTVRPHLLRHGSPSGTVKVEIRNILGDVVGSSATRLISDIGTGTYWHGYALFDVAAHLDRETTYLIALVAGGGYAFSETDYLGWANGFDLGKYSPGYSPSTGFNAALDVEIWTRQQVKKGVA